MGTAVLNFALLLLLCYVWAASMTSASTTAESMATSTTAESMTASTTAESMTASMTAESMAASTTAESMAASTTLESLIASTTAARTMTSAQVTYSARPGTTLLPWLSTSPSPSWQASPSSSPSTASSPPSTFRTTTPFWSTTPARATCPEADQIHCGNSDRCTRIRYICDGDNDCGDNSDEANSLCDVWMNGDCDRNSARCTRNGRSDCITISHYCTLTNPPCNGTVDPRLCQMLHDGKIQPINSIQVPTTTPEPTEPPTTQPSIHITEELWTEEFLSQLNSTIRHPECPQLYAKVGDQCLSIFFIGSLNWLESRAFCQAIGGDLFTINKDMSNFVTILQHLSSHQMTADFWVGGRYMNETLGWTWLDNRPMPHGSPYWAVRHQNECMPRTINYSILNMTIEANSGSCYRYTQAPRTPPAGHCTALTYQHYYYITDEECFAKKSPLCVLPAEHPKQAL